MALAIAGRPGRDPGAGAAGLDPGAGGGPGLGLARRRRHRLDRLRRRWRAPGRRRGREVRRARTGGCRRSASPPRPSGSAPRWASSASSWCRWSGSFLGFVLGVYLAEHRRVGAGAAWPSTRARAAGGRAQHPHRARRRAAGRAGVWVAGVVVLTWPCCSPCCRPRRLRAVRLRRRRRLQAGEPLGGRAGRPARRRRAGVLALARRRRLPHRRRPGVGAAGRARQRVRHGVPLPRALRRAGWAWWPRSRASAPPGPGRGRASLAGERPGAWSGSGCVAALPAIWLVSREPATGARRRRRRVWRDGVLAGLGLRHAVRRARADPDGGRASCRWRSTRSSAAVAIIAVATALRRPGCPADRAGRSRRGQRRCSAPWRPAPSWSPRTTAS